MLTLGILSTFMWAIPFFILVSPVTPPPPPQLLYEDDFSNPHTGWISESTEEVESDYEDSEYHILVKERDWWYFVWNQRAGQFTDFTLEIDARLISGPTVSSCGLVFRIAEDGNTCYRFLVSADGYYAVGILLNDTWIDLQPWTKSAVINQVNSTNHLKVVCQGSQIEVYVNGQHLTSITDNSFAEGYVGVIVDTTEPTSHVAFDNIRVYRLN